MLTRRKALLARAPDATEPETAAQAQRPTARAKDASSWPPVVAWETRPWRPWVLPMTQASQNLLPPEARRPQASAEPCIWVPQAGGQGVMPVQPPPLDTAMSSARAPRASEWFMMLANSRLFGDNSTAMTIVGTAAVLVSGLYGDSESLAELNASDMFIVSLRLACKLEVQSQGKPHQWRSALHDARRAAAFYQNGSDLGVEAPSMEDLNGAEIALLEKLNWGIRVPPEQCAQALRMLRARPHNATRLSLALASHHVQLESRLSSLLTAGPADL